MRNIVKSRIKLLFVLLGAATIITSCKYKVIADADYPDQLIYMPAAIYNQFTINDVPKAIGYDPTPGYPVQFSVDTVTRKFNVLLGVYRSGIDNNGGFMVDIAVNTDTITKLLASGGLPATTRLLAADKYSIPTSVVMKDGSDLAKFDLSINLDSLRANYVLNTGKQFALGVGISSTERSTNPKLATTIIVINTRLMKPTANFTWAASVAPNTTTINFTNTSVYGMKYTWDFGDGTPRKITTNSVNEAVTHMYGATGTYTVKLTVQGVADYADRSVKTTIINVL